MFSSSAACQLPCVLSICLFAGLAGAETVVLEPIKDNTVIENPSGLASNALNEGIYSGRVGFLGGGLKVRAILAFDIAKSIPAGSTIESATLTLTVLQAPNLIPHAHSVHRVLANWGEGESVGPGGQGGEATPGDVTWLNTFFPDQIWKNPGGDFEPDPSDAQGIEFETLPYVVDFDSAGILADVQAWHSDPQSNFGWIIVGDEKKIQTARKFGSRENKVVESRPHLTIVYTSGGSTCVPDIAPPGGNGTVNVDDLLAIINGWGPCKDDCIADIAPAGGNAAVDVDDLLLIINSWGDCK